MIKVPREFVIMGVTDLDRDKFQDVKNNPFPIVKPGSGGLWASPYTPNAEFPSAWYEWCMSEMPGWIEDQAVIITLKEDINCFTIDNQMDLKVLLNLVGENKGGPLNTVESSARCIDFERASEDFDAIYLTEKGQANTRLPFKNPELSLYGWDVESILIMNFDCIESWRSVKFNVEDQAIKELQKRKIPSNELDYDDYDPYEDDDDFGF